MNIVNLSTDAILYLAEAASRADLEGSRFRLSFGQGDLFYENGVKIVRPSHVCYKVGEGMWSAPFYDQADPYRS